jgi:hypothetical protein
MGRLITLLTDFGTRDGFVGAMKGVILSVAPNSQVVDLTHDIGAQDVRGGAWALREAALLFPPRTIHVAVVDPGVGGARRPLLLASRRQLFIGPDNGVLSLAANAPSGAWCLDQPRYHRASVSNTFHGRDIFAAVAGHLASGRAPDEVGTPLALWERLRLPRARRVGGRISGQVAHVDRFGNLITNIDAALLGGSRAWDALLDGESIGPLRSTFADVQAGEWVAYLGSGGMIEVAIRDGAAVEHLSSLENEIVLTKSSSRWS